MGNILNPVAGKQIVWLDVVRLLAMFTHSIDPFGDTITVIPETLLRTTGEADP